ncbi:MAG: hybrid sensor histidine kinase/response regulator [Bacteroidales bacterium]|jgi:signal transduction histidine kinase|nr:hybrid sensor histidine kinase/response regulator [Bacteroidales bacterium]MDD3810717.1 hybrid sensor histidine kinase/response regulator [Bacteroidales bacterium]MDD4812513.1 hybrid sensor histidine kinase/response regulator [Bacteroidales bacterium]
MEMLKVLVVDDEPGIRSGISRILSQFIVGYPFMDEDIGFEMMEAATGEEAIEIFHVNKPDVVLLDNKLPGMDGIQVLEYINQNALEIEVMMITSYASLELAVKATNIGAYDFVPKPFTPQELRASMENLTKHLFLKRIIQRMNKEGKQIRFQFLTVLSHELKNPLSSVEGYLRMMQSRQAGDSLEDYDEMITRSIKRIKGMRNLIMDLLDLTKIESGKKPREIKDTDLVKVARLSAEAMGPMAIQMEVEVRFAGLEKLILPADPEEMEIIMNNLISNAVKYNRRGGKVIIRFAREDNKAIIEVKDTGIGITQEDQSLLFREFVRIKSRETRNISGSGLGLSIVKRLLDLYDGDIVVRSTPGEGSCFKIELPVNTR